MRDGGSFPAPTRDARAPFAPAALKSGGARRD
jgi:hypothetical protein